MDARLLPEKAILGTDNHVSHIRDGYDTSIHITATVTYRTITDTRISD